MRKGHLNDLDLLRLRFWLSQMVLLLALVGLIFEDVSRSPLLLILTVFVAGTVVYPPLSGLVPRRQMGKLSLLMLAVVVGDFALYWRYSVDPIIRMGLLIIAMRTISYRTGRETSQVLVMALGMIILTGVTSVSVSYAVQLIVFIPLAMMVLILLTVWDPDSKDVMTHADWKGFSVMAFMGRLARAMNWRFPLMIVFGSIALLLMSAGLFFVFPRFNFGWGLTMQRQTREGSAMVGFSEDFTLGGISEILNDDRVAFRVHPDSEESVPAFPYWKMMVMDQYRRGSFSRSDRHSHALHPLQQSASRYYLPYRSFPPDYQREEGSNWTLYMEGSVSRFLPYPGAFAGIRFQKSEDFEYDSVFRTFSLLKIPSTMTVFQLIHVVPDCGYVPSVLDRSLIARSNNNYGSLVRENLVRSYPDTTWQLSVNDSDYGYLMSEVQLIRRQMAAEGKNDFLNATVSRLHEKHAYSLNPPVHRGANPDDDPVVGWMRNGSPGHCEYFAAAFTLLTRAAGYPCRVVKGFAGGQWSEYREYFVVRNRNAHAWCEVFDANAGWVRYDPTPPSDLLEGDLADNRRSLFSVGRWSSWWDTIKMRYYRYVIDFDEQDQMDAAMVMQNKMASWSPVFDRLNSALVNWMQGGGRDGGLSGKNAVRLMALMLAVVGFCSGVYLVFRWLFGRRNSPKRYHAKRTMASGFEARIRRNAGRVLHETSQSYCNSDDTTKPLWLMRYGPKQEWPAHPNREIRAARRQLRLHP
ncbi:MAG: DUF3488 and transglutaminase-like domain-containing protein [Opitutales bacterium]|nr:DUF3488 and transglutaminase-like domain-containing protein [Opitutales bacterium]